MKQLEVLVRRQAVAIYKHIGAVEPLTALDSSRVEDLQAQQKYGAIAAQRVTYDLARQLPGATEVSTSAFADAIIEHLA